MKICVSVVLMLFSVSAFSQSLDKHHLLLDSRLEASSKSRYAFRTLQEAVAHFTDETTLYVAPGVYWVDHPDTPKVVPIVVCLHAQVFQDVVGSQDVAVFHIGNED